MSALPISQKDLDALFAEKAANTKTAQSDVMTVKMDKTNGFVFSNGVAHKKIDVIVIDFAVRNTYFEGAWAPGKEAPPACWAVGNSSVTHNELEPSPNVEKPIHTNCSPYDENKNPNGCPMAAWGSAATGAGKACKNKIQLALIPPDADADSPLYLMDIAPTSLKPFYDTLSYVTAQLKKDISQVKMTLKLDQKTQYAKLAIDKDDIEPHGNGMTVYSFLEKSKEYLSQDYDPNREK